MDFTCKAQTSSGGWDYISAKDLLTNAWNKGTEFDEDSTTITQVQSLHAARSAGIPVSKEVIDKTHDYLRQCTTDYGGFIYSLARRDMTMGSKNRPTITKGIATLFNAGEYNSPLVKKWLKFVRPQISLNWVGKEAMNHSEYTQMTITVFQIQHSQSSFAKKMRPALFSLFSVSMAIAGRPAAATPPQTAARRESVRHALAWLVKAEESKDWDKVGQDNTNAMCRRDIAVLMANWLLEQTPTSSSSTRPYVAASANDRTAYWMVAVIWLPEASACSSLPTGSKALPAYTPTNARSETAIRTLL